MVQTKEELLAKRKKYNKIYYKKNREKLINDASVYAKKNEKKISEYRKKYFQENKEKAYKKYGEYCKRTGYAYDNSPDRKLARKIRAKTSYTFPLDGQLCEECNEQATERHHITKPMQYNKFKYLCHDCHLEEHDKMRIKNKKVLYA